MEKVSPVITNLKKNPEPFISPGSSSSNPPISTEMVKGALSSRTSPIASSQSPRILAERISSPFTEIGLIGGSVLGASGLVLSLLSKKRDHALAFGGMTFIIASTYLHLQHVKNQLRSQEVTQESTAMHENTTQTDPAPKPTEEGSLSFENLLALMKEVSIGALLSEDKEISRSTSEYPTPSTTLDFLLNNARDSTTTPETQLRLILVTLKNEISSLRTEVKELTSKNETLEKQSLELYEIVEKPSNESSRKSSLEEEKDMQEPLQEKSSLRAQIDTFQKNCKTFQTKVSDALKKNARLEEERSIFLQKMRNILLSEETSLLGTKSDEDLWQLLPSDTSGSSTKKLETATIESLQLDLTQFQNHVSSFKEEIQLLLLDDSSLEGQITTLTKKLEEYK